TTSKAGIVGSVRIVTVVAPESSELATISTRMVSSVEPGYASRRSSRRWSRSTRVSPTSAPRAGRGAPAAAAEGGPAGDRLHAAGDGGPGDDRAAARGSRGPPLGLGHSPARLR